MRPIVIGIVCLGVAYCLQARLQGEEIQPTVAEQSILTRGPYLQRGTTTNVLVRWRTSVPAATRARFGLDPYNLDRTAQDLSPKTEHEANLTGLSPNTYYYYTIETAAEVLAGPYYFLTAPTTAKPTRIWVLGDPGTHTDGQRAVRDFYYYYTTGRHTDLWLMLGDNAYGSGTDAEYQSAVFDTYSEMLSKSVLWPTIGNHDTYSDVRMIDFPYLHIFSLPTQGEAGGIASGTKRYYSFNYGNIHFACLDSMSSSRQPGSPMLQWLEQDLAANTNDWLIAYWHHPPYSKGSHDSDYEIELIEMRMNVLPILESHGVDLVLTGHSHGYERSFLINGHYGDSKSLIQGMKINPGDGRDDGDGIYAKTYAGPESHSGAVYAVAGCSGQYEGGTFDHPAMYISMAQLGSMILDINGNRLDARFMGLEGVEDYFTITKGPYSSRLEITDFMVDGDIFTISWTAIPGRYYWVQFSETMELYSWDSPFGPFLATQTTETLTEVVPTGANANFFRIWLVPD